MPSQKLQATARCLGRHCEWHQEGDPAPVDKAADKHTDVEHPTATMTRPVPAASGGAR